MPLPKLVSRQQSTATFKTISGNPTKSPNTVGNNFYKFKTIDLNNERLKNNLSYIEDFQYEISGIHEYHETLINNAESSTNDLERGTSRDSTAIEEGEDDGVLNSASSNIIRANSNGSSPRLYKKITSSNFVKRLYLKMKYYTIWKPFLTLLLIGLLIGTIASALQILTEYLNNIKMGYCKSNFLLNRSYCCAKRYDDLNTISREFLEEQCVIDGHWQHYDNPVVGFSIYGILSVLYSTFAGFLVFKFAPFAAGGGIPEIKMSLRGFQYNSDFYSFKTTMIKCITLPLTIASGLNVGKEGPSVHYGTSVAVLVSEFINQKLMSGNPDLKTGLYEVVEENTDRNNGAASHKDDIHLEDDSPESNNIPTPNERILRKSQSNNKIPNNKSFIKSTTTINNNHVSESSRLFNPISQNFFDLSEYMLAGASGGVALAFAAPIGGVLFIFEELCSNYIKFNITAMWKCYFITMVGITILKIINPFRNGEVVQFEIRYNENWRLEEIPIFIIIGIFGGCYGILMKRMNVFWINFRNLYLKNHLQFEVFVLTVVTFLLSYFNSFLKLDMTESMKVLFHECSYDSSSDNSIWDHDLCKITNTDSSDSHWYLTLTMCASLLYALVIRFLLVAISYGCKLPCGIFIPSMSIGALFGRLLSIVIVKMFNIKPGTIIEGSYALLGAGAALTGMTHLTISCVVIIFELTGAFNHIVPTMVTVGITRLIIDKFDNGKGIAEDMCLFNKFPFLEDEPPIRLSKDLRGDSITADDFMTCQIISLRESMSVNEIKIILRQYKFSGFPVVTKEGTVSSYVYRQLLEHIVQENLDDTVINLQSLNHLDFVIKSILYVNKHDNILLIHDIFNNISPKLLMVQDNFKLVGLITKKDLIKFEHEQFIQLNGDVANQFKFNQTLIEKIYHIIFRVFRAPTD